MKPRPLVVITTELPPATCGIGTYSWNLRRHWPNDSRAIEFLVRENGAAKTTPLGDPIRIVGTDKDALARELDRVGDADVLLHFAGRAYHSLGFPFWLAGALARWKRRHGDARLGVFVHEMPARFPITSHHFWISKLSDFATRRLCTSADVLLTNTTEHRDKLRALSGRNDIHLVPISSNIGVASPLSEPRAATEFVILGRPFGRLQTLRLFADSILRWRKAGLLTRLHLVGTRDETFTAQADEMLAGSEFVTDHGELSDGAIATVLRRAQFALTNASESTWSKSTVLMACVANECSVVVAGPRPAEPPLSFAIAADEVGHITPEELQRRSNEFARWYQTNADWPVIAKRISAIWSDNLS
ncbi:MAG: glycosyltransferase [Verrucomicrobiota bacterium]|nr:glycosyltransferase [Verrucomicrobiota bacterium]